MKRINGKLLANHIVDLMVDARKVSHPDEVWTRNVPMEVQRRLFPEATGIAHESDNGRGAIAMDLYGKVPTAGGMIIDEVTISVKSQVKPRKIASSASLTAGTMDHVTNIVKALMNDRQEYPVVYVAQDTRDGQWRQTFFDAGEVMRAVAANPKYAGNTGIPGISWAGGGVRGVPVVLRTTPRKGTDNLYYQLNFNLGVLVTPKGVRVPRAPGVYGLGLAEPWREVDAPEIQWEKR